MDALLAPPCDSWIFCTLQLVNGKELFKWLSRSKLPVPLANDGAEGSLVGVGAFGVVRTGTEMKEQRNIIVNVEGRGTSLPPDFCASSVVDNLCGISLVKVKQTLEQL